MRSPLLRSRRPRTDGSDALVGQLTALKVEGFKTQYRFHPQRRWSFDIAFPVERLGVEVDGGLFVHGAHSRGQDREDDMAKDAAAMAMGWRVLRVSPRHVRTGDAVRWIESILGAPP